MTKITYLLFGLLLLNLATWSPSIMAETEKPAFKYGVSGDPETIDPAQAWDSMSIDIIDQVCEGLLAYDLFNPELALIPRLATDLGTWNLEATELTFNIRQNVTFHDGTPFNATAVKYTFDRLTHLIENGTVQIAELYKPLADLYPMTPLVINETLVMSEFVVKFILNYPYVPFLSLLCFSGSYIVHPTMPFDRLIALDEPLIGTGPYMLNFYSDEETHFLAYQNYYSPQPEIQEILWIKFDDSVALAQAFLTGEVDMPDSTHPDYIDDYEASPDIHVDPPMAGTCIYYIGMNNQDINLTFRHAISYAVDYDYLISDIVNAEVVRMQSIIPAGILYHDSTVIPADKNLTKARQILIDAGLVLNLTATSTDLSWYNLAETTPIATFNYTYNCCDSHNPANNLPVFIQNNLKLIGIRIDIVGLTWPAYLSRLLGDFDKLQLYQIGWCSDYNDPSNYINPTMSNTSLSNAAQINDPWLQNAMMQALAETNTTARRALYGEIQHYIVEELMPWVFLYTSISKAAWSIHLGNFPRNPMGKLYFYPCTWYTTTTPTITTETNTTTTLTTSTSETTPTSPSVFISGNVKAIFFSLCCVPIVLAYTIRKKSHLIRP